MAEDFQNVVRAHFGVKFGVAYLHRDLVMRVYACVWEFVVLGYACIYIYRHLCMYIYTYA